jgi:hypothetical protein
MRSHSALAAAVAEGEGLKMRLRVRALVPMFAAVLALGAPLAAHHGDAAYAATPMEMKGCVVTEFDWMNPHSLIKFDYRTATGEVQHWTMEIGSPPSMTLLGWSRTTLRAGDVITAYVYQARSGVQVGRTNKVILADGTVLADRDDSTPSRYGTTEAPK